MKEIEKKGIPLELETYFFLREQVLGVCNSTSAYRFRSCELSPKRGWVCVKLRLFNDDKCTKLSNRRKSTDTGMGPFAKLTAR
jgi:hypothetical protein